VQVRGECSFGASRGTLLARLGPHGWPEEEEESLWERKRERVRGAEGMVSLGYLTGTGRYRYAVYMQQLIHPVVYGWNVVSQLSLLSLNACQPPLSLQKYWDIDS